MLFSVEQAFVGGIKNFGYPQRQLCFLLFQGDEGRSTFAMSNLHWGAFRDANEKQDK